MASIVEVLKELDGEDMTADKGVAVLADVEDRLRNSTVFSANELSLVRMTHHFFRVVPVVGPQNS